MIRRPVNIILFVAILVFAASARADAPAVSLGFFGETLLHPGLRGGAELALVERGRHRLGAGGNVGGYLHEGNHYGLLVDAEGGYRYTFDGGFFGEARAGAGYLRTFLDGDVFERRADGGGERVPLAGQNGLAITQALGAGYDLSRRHGTPLSVFFRLGAFEQYPFNDGFLVHLTSQLGISWQLGR